MLAQLVFTHVFEGDSLGGGGAGGGGVNGGGVNGGVRTGELSKVI